ncbi:MAG: diadenylate cyclase [Anaerolineales bacterium]|nr:diadenylate cyclase [Anaerolineales bacterium]
MNISLEQVIQQLSYYIAALNWESAIDIALVTLIIFSLMRLIRGTRAIQVLRGFLIVATMLWAVLLLTPLDLPALNWLIDQTLPAMFLAIPVIFQPELRRALERVGGASGFWRLWQRRNQSNKMITSVVEASRRLSQRRHGALIVFEQETGLQEYIDTGVALDAKPSPELFLTLFNKNTELHDGAIIIRGEMIAAAACVMPLSSSNLSDR